jgi:hypothetical protein
MAIFHARQQQVVGRFDRAAEIGKQEVQSASHADLLRNKTV